MELTRMEREFLNGMRTNCYSDIYESNGDWLFAVVDECSFNEVQAKGVATSLKNKGLIFTDSNDDGIIVGFTEMGRSIWDNADGDLNVGWGGPRLLRLEDEKPKKKVGEQKQLRMDLEKIFKANGIDAKIQIRSKRVTMIICDRMIKGDIALHAKIWIGDQEMEWAIGECNYIDPYLFNDNARAEIIKLGF